MIDDPDSELDLAEQLALATISSQAPRKCAEYFQRLQTAGLAPGLNEGEVLEVLHAVAELRLMLDAVDPDTASTQLVGLELGNRSIIFTMLWLRDWWEEPWISFLDAEFPGPAVDVVDIAAAELQRPEVELQAAQSWEDGAQLNIEMAAFLAKRGLISDRADAAALMMVAVLSVRTQARQATLSSADGLLLRMAAQDIVAAMATNADLPAWVELLDRYFPIPA